MATRGNPTYDGGSAYAHKSGVTSGGQPQTVTSADASSTPLVITDVPDSGQKIVLDDIEISTDTSMLVTLRTTTGHYVKGKYYVTANATLQITTRGPKTNPTADDTFEVLTSVSGNIAVTATYHSA